MLLLAVALWVEPADIMAEVQRFSLGWMVLALAISVLQVMLSAWRWQLTAGLIGVPLRFGYALREYYLALLVNQLLPGGVLGDAGRAHRHAGQATSRGSAWRAVVIERASGQVAVALLTLAALLASPLWHAALGPTVLMSLAAGALFGLAGLALLIHWTRRQRLALPRWCQTLGRDLRRGLFQRRVWPLQLGSSLTIVISYGLVMLCAARAIGSPIPAFELLALAPVLLLSMLVPLSVAGWGVREGAAAGLWMLVGMPPAQGVAISLAYGVLVLLSSLPGIPVALARRGQASPAGPPASSASGGGVMGAAESGAAQLDVEQRVGAASERAHRGAQRLRQGVDGGHHQPGPPRTNQQRGHQQVQAIHGLGFDELRNGDAATFHQNAVQSALCQQCNDIVGLKLPMGIQRQAALLGSAVQRGYLRSGDVQRRHVAWLKQRQCGGHATARVQHHANRVGPIDMAHGELGVVGRSGAGAHHHGIGQGAQPVQVHQTFRAVDVVGMAAFRGDTPIQTLAQLRDHPLGPGGQRGQAIEPLLNVRPSGLWRLGLRGKSRRLGHAPCRGTQRDQPFPGRLIIEGRGVSSRRTGVGHNASLLDTPTDHAGPGSATQVTFVQTTRQSGGLHVSH